MGPPEPARGAHRVVLGPGSYREHLRIGEILRQETVGGFLLLAATVVALVLANTGAADWYFGLRDTELGYEPWHLRLTVGEWAADGLLAVFFFMVGLELKREFVAGDLRQPAKAVVPIAAAAGGVAVPALIYVGVNLAAGLDGLRGWAIPTATDIAFALAVLAVIGSHLPGALRIFLLTLAVVDDLIAIVIIAFFYSTDVSLGLLGWALLPLAAFALLVQTVRPFLASHPWVALTVLLPLALATWALVHASGVHATVAGVLLGFTVPVLRRGQDEPEPPTAGRPGLAEIFEHRIRPFSSGFAVPVFALFSAGVVLSGGMAQVISNPVALGVVLGLVLGKPLGILLTTWLLTTVTRARLDTDLRWVDLAGLGVLSGIGFTVSLLVNDLSFDPGTDSNTAAKLGILTASLLAAAAASAILLTRNHQYRVLEERERRDTDRDGIPDAFDDDDEGQA